MKRSAGLEENFGGGTVAGGLPWPVVQFVDRPLKLFGGDLVKTHCFREALPEQAVGVLVSGPLIRAVRVREAYRRPEFAGNIGMAS